MSAYEFKMVDKNDEKWIIFEYLGTPKYKYFDLTKNMFLNIIRDLRIRTYIINAKYAIKPQPSSTRDPEVKIVDFPNRRAIAAIFATVSGNVR